MSVILLSESCVLSNSSIIFRIPLSSPVITVWRLFDSSPTLVRTLVFTLRPVSRLFILRLFLLSVLFRDCSFCTLAVSSLDPEPSIRTKTGGGGESRYESFLLIARLKVTKPWTNLQKWTFHWNIPTRFFLNAHRQNIMFSPIWQWVCDFFMLFLLNRKLHWVQCLLYDLGPIISK